MNDALKDPEAKAFQKDVYVAAVERLTAERWRRQWEEDED